MPTSQSIPLLPHENDRHAFHHNKTFRGHAHAHGHHHKTFHDHVHAHVSLLPFHGEHHHVRDLILCVFAIAIKDIGGKLEI